MGLRHMQKILLMIYAMKVPKKGAFMITITIVFSSSKNTMRSINDVLAGNSDRYPIERSNKRYFQSLYVQFSPRKWLLCSFLPENCSKHALVGSRWVSGADQQYIMSIFFWNLRWDGSHLLLIISVILSVNFFTITFKTIFLLFSHVFHKRMYKLCVT